MARRPPRRRVTYLPEAERDLQRLADDDLRLARRALGLLSLLALGDISGQRLNLLPSYGDLSDCRKIYFGLTGEATSHRIVYREIRTSRSSQPKIEVLEVVAVEARADAYVYLLAAQRLGRLPTESELKAQRAHQAAILRRKPKKR